MLKTNKTGSVELVLAMIIVGSTFVVTKVLTATIPLFLTNSLRFLIAAMVLLPLAIKKLPEVKKVQPADIKHLMLAAILGVFLFNVLLFWGLRYVTAGTSGIITSLTPIATMALSVMFLREKLSRPQVMAAIAATAGLILINTYSASCSGSACSFSSLGSSLIFGVVLCDAAFTLLVKSVTRRVAPEVMTLIVVYFSFLLFLPFGIWQMLHFHLGALTTKDWLLILYLGMVVNVLAYFLWSSGLKKASASEAAVFTGVMPISSLLLAFLFLHEHISLIQCTGLLLVLCGVFMATKRKRSKTENSVPDESPVTD